MGNEPLGEVSPSVAATLNSLRVDAVTAELLRALDAARIKSIVLKGPSIAAWLYDDGTPRGYGDTDLLIKRDSANAVEGVMTQLGFRRFLPDHAVRGWTDLAEEWLREDDGASADIHWSLPGAELDPDILWDELQRHTVTMAIGGEMARVLEPSALAMHVALHAAQHGAKDQRTLLELSRALDHAHDSTWRDAANLARRLSATGALWAGLNLCQAGRELADRLGLPAERSIETELRAASAPPMAVGLAQLAAQPGLRRKLALLRDEALPPRAYMLDWSPLARRGRAGMAIARIQRIAWLAFNAPRGALAWRRAARRLRRTVEPGP
jgi:hypothetical protein